MTQTYHHGDLAQVVVDTATQILEKDGADGISIRQIAKEIGVSHQAPYRHFKSKQDVLAAVRAGGFKDFADAARMAAAQHPKSSRQQLQAAGQSYVSLASSRPALYKLMFGGAWKVEQLKEEHRNAAGEAFRAISTIIQQGPPPHNKKTVERTRIYWATLHGIVTLNLNGFLNDTELQGLARTACRSLTRDWFG